MKKETNIHEQLLAILLIIITAPLLMLYTIHVINDIVKWYGIDNPFSTKQIFGVLIILSLLMFKKSTKSETDKSLMRTFFEDGFTKAFFITLTWGMAYIYSLLIF